MHHKLGYTPYTIRNILCYTPYTIHCAVHIRHTPYTTHHTPYTKHHTPSTIHHTPYTTHHTPYTIVQSINSALCSLLFLYTPPQYILLTTLSPSHPPIQGLLAVGQVPHPLLLHCRLLLPPYCTQVVQPIARDPRQPGPLKPRKPPKL
jgi:hypothetical protein